MACLLFLPCFSRSSTLTPKEETNDIIIHKCKERCSCCRRTNFHSALFLGGFIFVMFSVIIYAEISFLEHKARRRTYNLFKLHATGKLIDSSSLPGYSVSWKYPQLFFFSSSIACKCYWVWPFYLQPTDLFPLCQLKML